MSINPVRSTALFAIICLCSLSVGCAGFSSSSNGSAKNLAGTSVCISGTISPSARGTATTVRLRGAASATTTTDSSGNYKFSGLSTGTYTVTPSKNQFAFSPGSQNVAVGESDILGVNFSASQIRPTGGLTISGRISPMANGQATTVILRGAASDATTTDSAGNFTFFGLSAGLYTVTPSKDGFTFNPASHRADLSATSMTGVNFSSSPVVSTTTYSLSGTISPAANGSGATVTLGGGIAASTTADSSGNYSFIGLPSGTYAVTPGKNGFNFSPGSQHATLGAGSVTGVNFSANKAVSTTTYSITGNISPAANGHGATVTLGGAASASTTTDSAGNYRFNGLPNGMYTVTPSKGTFQFNPSSQSTTVNAANVTGLDFSASEVSKSTVNIYPGQDIPNVVQSSPAGTTFIIHPGTYRLKQSIIPKDGDSFIGQTACAPPATSCPAIISGSTVIGPKATFDGNRYRVTNQTQQGPVGYTARCDAGWSACIYPEDLYFDGVPYRHLSSSTLPVIGPGQWWFDYANHTIYFHDNPAGHNVETSVLGTAFGGPANDVTIQYLTVEEFASMYPNGPIGVYQGSKPQTQGANWTVENCDVLLNHGYGVRIGYRMRILNNYIHNNGQNGIGGGLGTTQDPSTESLDSGILIQGNVVNHNDYAHFDPDFGSGGIKLGSTSGVTIRANTIQYNEGAGIHFDDYSQNEFVDNNIITDNIDAGGIAQEIGYGSSTFRNNLVLRNGAQVNDAYWNNQIEASSSSGVDAYCNTVEIAAGPGINGWDILAADRGPSKYPPYSHLISTDNYFHHNTVIWDPGATGGVGFFQGDPVHQPNFIAANAPPDHNTYHLASTSRHFSYKTRQLTFAEYQASGADVHGTADNNNTSGFPRVAITSPVDQSSFSKSVTVTATASDKNGISKIEFYLDWALQATVTAAPYSVTLHPAAPGQYHVAAMAYSNSGIRACYAVTLNAN